MPSTKSYATLHARVLARDGAQERLAKLREDTLREIALFELRNSLNVSQMELAERLHVSQPSISKLEHADDLRVSTLREYIEALGGTLEIHAKFGDEDHPIALGREQLAS